jgi:tuberculosinol/isotuberculosinol synthase
MDLDRFQALTSPEIAQMVRADGPKTCVFPINGTRRWFFLEHPLQPGEDAMAAYLDVAGKRHVELYRLFFDHGLDTLLTPVFGPDLLERGQDYTQMAVDGLARLAIHPDFVDFYEACRVRVRFYGDHHNALQSTPFAHLSDLFDRVTEQTRVHDQHRLFFGVFAHDAIETVARLAVDYHLDRGTVPDKDTLIRLYYGESVAPIDLFIGFERFCAFDMPLLATGEEDLYFTISPSPYMDRRQLRHILYDHLYARRGAEPDYASVGDEAWSGMKAFYRANMDRTLGVGTQAGPGGIWVPLPQVEIPEDLSATSGMKRHSPLE